MLSPTLGVSGESSSATGSLAGTSGPSTSAIRSANASSSAACASTSGTAPAEVDRAGADRLSVMAGLARAVHPEAHRAVHLDLAPEPAAARHLDQRRRS